MMNNLITPQSDKRLKPLDDKNECVWCRKTLWARDNDSSIDHVIPKVKGGPSWPENEVTACKRCNSKRGAKMPLAYALICASEGYQPNRELLESKLRSLHAILKDTSGHKRLKAKLDHQMRRL
jgi:5-methylcytosine-specific restriction endonuclease McrA